MRKIPAPRVLPESLPFWQAADAGRLVVKKCNGCGKPHHYPRDICPFCLSDDTTWAECAGTGTLYSFSTMGKGDDAFTLAYVTLDEGVTLLSNVIARDPGALRVGQPVRVVFQPSQGGHAVPMFTPTEPRA